MFFETPRYVGFPNQLWVEDSFAFKNFESMFKNKAPFFVSTFQFKDKDTPIVDNLFFDIDSYFSVRVPWRNVKLLRTWCYQRDIPTLTNFSVSEDTPILVKVDREIKLISIVDVINNFKEGRCIEVLSYSKDNGVVFSLVYNYLEHDDKLYKIYHEQSGLPLELTEHHSIYKWDNSEIVKVKKSDLKIGDFLITFRQLEDVVHNDNVTIKQEYTYRNKNIVEDIEITDSLLSLMGYYVAEGHTSKTGLIGFSFNRNETKYHDEVKHSLRLLKPYKFSIDREINISESFPNYSENQILISSQKYRPFFVEQCGSTQEYRHVPSFLFGMSKEKFLIFLTSYLNGDGSYKKKGAVSAKTISKRLAIELTWLCKIHGISCSFMVNDDRDKRPEFCTKIVYTISINKKDLYNRERNNKFHPETRDKMIPIDALKKVYHQCKPKGFNKHRPEQMTLNKESACSRRIMKVLEWFDETKSIPYTNESKVIIENYKKIISRNDIGFLRIKKISRTSEKNSKVYDISVIDTENFFCGAYPILHSNSGAKGFHFYLLLKPFVPISIATQNRTRDLMYSVQMRLCKDLGVEAFDEGTFARLRFLMRYPTSRYIRRDEDTAEFVANGFYCRNLSDEEFDAGVKQISKVVREPGVVPKAPKSDFTLQDICDMFKNFKVLKRQEKGNVEKIYLQRAGMTVPTIPALGIPCLKELCTHSHPNHFERIELVSWLKHLGYTDIVINQFIKNCNWTRFKSSETQRQVNSIHARPVRCSFLRKSYGYLCDKCPLKSNCK